jgi:hypothetical protein
VKAPVVPGTSHAAPPRGRLHGYPGSVLHEASRTRARKSYSRLRSQPGITPSESASVVAFAWDGYSNNE